jgi:IS30 family transposase
VWVGDTWERTLQLHIEGYSPRQIALKLGLAESTVENKLENELRAQKAAAKQAHVDPEILARNARHEAAERRDLTATFFGDPPPGYSALDQKRKGIAP